MSYQWIEHTGELELRIDAATEAAVFEDAMGAVRELLSNGGDGERVSREFRVEAADRAALLAAWIDELVYVAESEGLVPEHLTEIRLHAEGLAATVTAQRAEPPHLIKAATYHRLELTPREGGFHATVVLDV